MMRRVWLAWIAVAALLGGCASVDPAAVRQQVVGEPLTVVSLVSDQVDAVWIGTTIFNNEHDRTEKPAWQLPAAAQEAARSALAAEGPYSAVSVRAEPSMSKSDLLKAPGVSDGFMLVISPVRYPESALNRVGVHQHSVLGLKPLVNAYASLEGDLIDVKSGQSVARVIELAGVGLPAPVLEPGAKLKPESEEAVSGSVREQVKAAVQGILKRLGLI